MQSQLNASALPATQERGPRKAPWVGSSISTALSRTSLASVLYRAYVACRSFRGHIRILFSKAGTRVDLGASCRIQDGCFLANTRTVARAEGIERILATHPWADSVDLRIFLIGFDAGEEYCKKPLQVDVGILESHIVQTRLKQ